MADYIMRETAIQKLKSLVRPTENGFVLAPTLADCVLAVENVPAANVVEHKRGTWMEKDVSNEPIGEWQIEKCSECGRYLTTPYLYYFSNHNFCPYCGADMRKDGEADG